MRGWGEKIKDADEWYALINCWRSEESSRVSVWKISINFVSMKNVAGNRMCLSLHDLSYSWSSSTREIQGVGEIICGSWYSYYWKWDSNGLGINKTYEEGSRRCFPREARVEYWFWFWSVSLAVSWFCINNLRFVFKKQYRLSNDSLWETGKEIRETVIHVTDQYHSQSMLLWLLSKMTQGVCLEGYESFDLVHSLRFSRGWHKYC